MSLSPDVHAAVRQFARRPFAHAAALLALALGIGSSVGLFSLVDAVLLRPLPYPGADRMVAVWDAMPEAGYPRSRVSGFNYLRLREQARSFEALALFGSTSGALTGLAEPIEVEGFRVTCNAFAVLGVRAQSGRLIADGDCDPAAPPVMVITDTLWRRRFDADPGMVGRAVVLAGRPVTVVGVTPPVLLPADLIGEGRFHFADSEERIFVPVGQVPSHHGHVYGVLGRLADGAGLPAARAELNLLSHGWRRSFPDTHAGYAARVEGLTEELLASARQALGTLLLGALLLLAAACTNVAHFHLEGVLQRDRQSALRAALGASRAQVARPFVIEGLLLAGGGGLLGTALAHAALRSAAVLLPRDLPRVASAHIDNRSLAAALTLALLAGGSTGLLAGFRAARRDLAESLGSGRRWLGVGAHRLRSTLLAGQASLAVVLVALAALLGSSLDRLSRVQTGFAQGELLVVDFHHGTERYRERAQLVGFYDELQSRVAALPGVVSVGASYDPPLHSNWLQGFEVVDAPEALPDRGPSALFRTVTPGYFAAAGVGIAEGGDFTNADDVGSAGAVIVNRALARRYLGAASPLGRKISLATTQWMWGEMIPRTFTVVGVAADERIGGLTVAPEPAFYLPYRQTPQHQMSLLVRAGVDAASLLPAVTRLVQAIDPGQPVAASSTLRAIVAEQLARPRLNAFLAVGFGLAALALAALGVGAALAESISRRAAELGVRLALGSSPWRLFGLALGEGLRPALLGALLGTGLALAGGRLVASQLFGVKPWDPGLHAAAFVGVLLVSLVACAAPAWRAARTGPATALRHES